MKKPPNVYGAKNMHHKTYPSSPQKTVAPSTNSGWTKRDWLKLLPFVVSVGFAIYKLRYKSKQEEKSQQRAHSYKTVETAQSAQAHVDAIDRTHEHRMTEKEKDLEIASEKMEMEYSIWERKEEYREMTAQKKKEAVDYDHPCESIVDIINQPNRITKFEYISDTPLTIGDLACVYSIPAMGKSILVNQILFGARSGEPTGLGCFPVDNTRPLYALLYDAEQTVEDIQVRYGSNSVELPAFEIVQDCNFDDDPDLLLKDVERKVWAKKMDTLVCIDNTSKIFPTIKAKMVTKTVRGLEALQARAKADGFSLTILLVTHSVKDPKKKKEVSNMSGSANWSRFAKTVISLSPTENDNFKVMKIEKNRRGKQGQEFILRLAQDPYPHFVNDDVATTYYIQQKPTKEELRTWPTKIRGVSRQLALELESAYIPQKYGAGKLYQQFQGRPGITNEKQIQRIIKDVQALRAKSEEA